MYRKVLATMLLLGALSGCSKELGTCGPNGECGAGGVCDVARNLCYTVVEAEIDGGACTPACAPYEACTSRGCAPRYAALTVTPGDGGVVGAGAVEVQAELVLQPGAAANFPETLDFRVVRSDGGAGGTLTAGPRTAGVYPAQWTPPGDGEFLLTAAYPRSGGPSTTVHLTADTTPPTFTVTVPTADAGMPDGGTSYADPSLPTAWRRDQTVAVRIESDSPDLDAGSLSVLVRGHDGGTNLEGLSVAQTTPCVGKSFCGSVDVPLWQPGLPAFRGNFAVEVTASDRVGNQVTRTGSIPVTRWKWVFDAQSGVIRATPAIGQLGTVYFGTTTGTDGKVFALRPDGAKQWEVQLGAVEASAAVGAYDAGTELVYVGAKSSNGVSLYALRGDDGGTRLKCPGSGASETFGSGALAGAIAVGLTTEESVETAVSVFNASSGNSAIVGIKPAAGFAQCQSVVSPGTGEKIPALTAGGSVVMRNEDIFYPGIGLTSPKVTSYTFGSNTPRSNWPINLSIVPRNLALIGTNVIGAGGSIDPPISGGLFTAPQDGAADVVRLYPEASWASRVFNFVVGSGSAMFFGAEPNTGDIQFNRLDTSTSALLTASSASPIRAAPVAGRDGFIYTATIDGVVGAWRADDVSPRWVLSAALGAVEASPTIDCSRNAAGAFIDGNHGVLYVAAGGKLHAIIVDSRGLDTSAPWPKYQHDARNTGNPSTPISSCP